MLSCIFNLLSRPKNMPTRFALGTCLALATATHCLAAERAYRLPVGVREKCLQQLRTTMNGSEFWPAMHAAEALTLAGHTSEVRSALEPKLATEHDDQHRCGLARELVRAGHLSRVSVMVLVLGKQDTYAHTHAAESLYKIGQAGDTRLLQRAAQQREIPKLQLMAAAALTRSGDPGAIALIRAALEDQRPEVRQVVAWLLARLGDPRDIAPLSKVAARETDPVAKAYELIGLAALGDPPGRQALANYLADKNPELRAYAAEMVGYCRAVELAEPLTRLLEDPAIDVRVRAAQSLILLGQGV
ncbi:MAG TPA: HEAT repeat domain-containing protein [Pirellulales bacterium]|jgi:sialidase-1|nr:HEAT repeat domain-containing protein [Pirellulales bacterium]